METKKDFRWSAEIHMDPVPKQETQVFYNKYTRKRQGVTPPKTRRAKQTIREEISRQAPKHPFTGPLAIRIIFYQKRPKSVPIRKRKYPWKNTGDWDNFSKLVCDGCNKTVFLDDSQIVEAHVFLRYADDCHPRIIVSVEPLEEDGQKH